VLVHEPIHRERARGRDTSARPRTDSKLVRGIPNWETGGLGWILPCRSRPGGWPCRSRWTRNGHEGWCEAGAPTEDAGPSHHGSAGGPIHSYLWGPRRNLAEGSRGAAQGLTRPSGPGCRTHRNGPLANPGRFIRVPTDDSGSWPGSLRPESTSPLRWPAAAAGQAARRVRASATAIG
jgi:hypothetical protein